MTWEARRSKEEMLLIPIGRAWESWETEGIQLGGVIFQEELMPFTEFIKDLGADPVELQCMAVPPIETTDKQPPSSPTTPPKRRRHLVAPSLKDLHDPTTTRPPSHHFEQAMTTMGQAHQELQLGLDNLQMEMRTRHMEATGHLGRLRAQMFRLEGRMSEEEARTERTNSPNHSTK
jgi:hypothetical protein